MSNIIMRRESFHAEDLRRLLRHAKIATMPELKKALGTAVDLTVFRKLKQLSYRTSYSHRGSYYALDEIMEFDKEGLWSFDAVWFSRHGALLASAEALVESSDQGYFAEELDEVLHVETKDALRQLVQQDRIARELVSGLYLYCSRDSDLSERQLRRRREHQQKREAISSLAQGEASDELKAAMGCCSSACSMKSSAGCMPVWNR